MGLTAVSELWRGGALGSSFAACNPLGRVRFAIAVYFRSPNFPVRTHPCDLLRSAWKNLQGKRSDSADQLLNWNR